MQLFTDMRCSHLEHTPVLFSFPVGCSITTYCRRQLIVQKNSVGAAYKVSPNWSQETMTCHSSDCFSIVWGQGNAPLVTSLLSSYYMAFKRSGLRYIHQTKHYPMDSTVHLVFLILIHSIW